MKLFDFQQAAVDRVIAERRLCVFAEQGCGKSHIVAGALERLMLSQDHVRAMLVVPLANLETTWVTLLSRELPDLEIHRKWSTFKASDASCKCLLLNYEAMRGKSLKKIVAHEWSFICYDESQRLKARGSKASRASARFKHGEFRVALSGTPIEQAPQDLWAQLRFVDDDLLGSRWADFDAEWLRPTGYMGYQREFLWNKLNAFVELVSPRILRVTKAEVLDLPPLKLLRSTVPLLGEQARVYRELEKHMTTVLVGGEEIICDMAITQLVRLQQVAGGFIRTEDGRSVRVGRAKARRLKSIARDEERPLVVFTKYREELADAVEILESLGMSVGVVSGDTRKTRATVIEQFQAGGLDALVCQIRTGGVGLDLFRACVGIIYSATFSSIDFEQAMARLHRYGQTREVRMYLISAAKTVDSTIQLMLATKRKVAEKILDGQSRRKKNG
jgi:SNF2 family DNA or RNA helicase